MEKMQTQPLSATSRLWRYQGRSIRINREKAFLAWRGAWKGLLLWALFIIFLALVQFSTPDLPDNDGFYHIKLAYIMRTESLKPVFPWLPLTILNPREFYDHHFLFHAALMPFTFGDLRLGAKWAAVLFASLAFLCVWNLLKNQRIRYASLWALGLVAVSEAFIYRMSITRAQSLSLALLALGIDWLLRKKFSRLAFLAFAYVWLYDAFPLLLIIAGIYVLAAWVIDRRLDVQPVVYAGIGTLLGLIINPYFPHNIVFAALHILPKLFETTAVSVGNEWYPYETAQLLENSPLALAAFASGALALGLSSRRMDLRTAVSFCLACLFGFMLFQSRRFIEYFPAFSLVFAAFAWTSVFEKDEKGVQESGREGSPTRAWKKASLFSQVWAWDFLRNAIRRHLVAIALVLVLIPGIWMTYNAAKTSLQRSKPYATYAGASAWLAANTPAGARVFQTDWDDFPRLFFYNTRNSYLIGLDPTYMLLYSEELYRSWVDITRGEVEKPSTPISEVFGASYVVSDLNHQAFLERAVEDPGLVEVYRDAEAVVFQVAGVDRLE
jgi:hypothetical protein